MASSAIPATELRCCQIGTGLRFPEPVRLDATTSGYLDAIRATAAIAVMLGHLRGLYFVDYGQIRASNANSFVKSFYALTGFGHQSVMVFFVLSGFFISSSVLRNYGRQRWSWRDYGIDRGVRLYVVLIPGILLGIMWDLLGIAFCNGSGLYSKPCYPFGYNVPLQNLSLSTFIGNLLFLQTRFVPVLGSNGPLWSLFNEFWYYVLFPLLIGVILAVWRRQKISAIGQLLFATLTAWVLRSQLAGFVVWLSGGGVAMTARYLRFDRSRRWPLVLYTAGVSLAFCLALVASRAGNPWLGSDIAVGLSFAFLVYGIVQLEIGMSAIGLTLAKQLAGFSYSLYILHFPVLFFVRAKWLPTLRWQPDATHLAYALCIGSGVMVYAFAVARMTEGRTSIIRNWIRTAGQPSLSTVSSVQN